MPMLNLGERRLHYVDDGDGAVFVLIHAFPFDAWMWEPQLRALVDRYRVIAPDLAGCGESDPPPDVESHSIAAWADDVTALLASLAIDRVVLVGASSGADV